VTELHREFVHAGSDVVEAFTYYAHREKMRVVGKEGLLEELNRNALALAKEVADQTGTLFAGDICNTNVFDPDDPESRKAVQAMFDEQVAWAAEAGVDSSSPRPTPTPRKRAWRWRRSSRPACPQSSPCASTRNP
jgi:betaine-homocysteine S-methyltransferase